MSAPTSTEAGWGTPGEGQAREAERRWDRVRTLVRRSALFVPVNVPRFVERAADRDADAVILDLEDSVPPAEKAGARRLVRGAMAVCGRGGADLEVRINKAYALAVEDLDASVWPGLDTVHFPKVEWPEEVQRLDALLTERERARGLPVGSVRLSLAVETALGLHNLAPIALASPRVAALSLGTEDYTLDLGIDPTPEGREVFVAKCQVVVAARLAGAQALGTVASIADYTHLDAMRAAIGQARQLGFMGAACIHPAQVAPLNEGFSPGAEDVARARRVVEAFEAAIAQGRASVGVDGKMVDIPVAARARRLLQRAAAVAAKEAQKRAARAGIHH
jgi:citrate lyase subunit beta/citryl-CoA lyase